MRQVVAIALTFVCLVTLSPADGQVPVDQAVRLKEQLNAMPSNASVEVRLHKKGRKIEGKLVAVRDEEFDVRVAGDRTVSNQTISFSDVQSVKEQKDSRPWVRIAVIGAVVYVSLTVLLYAAYGGS